MCIVLVGGQRRGHEYGQDRWHAVKGLVEMTVSIGMLIGGTVVIV